MYILIATKHIAKEESVEVTWVDTFSSYDAVKLAMNNAVAERLLLLTSVQEGWVNVDETEAHVKDEFCNEYHWLIFGTESTSKTISFDPYALGMDEED